MNDFAIIYHWWSTSPITVISDLANPILLSIKSVRYFHPHVPIYVLDVGGACDWDDYPSKLGFRVVKRPSRFKEAFGFKPKLISRIWDIDHLANEIDEENILFSDSDIFWLQPVFPLMGESFDSELKFFHCNKNNGLFYYHKRSKFAKEVYSALKAIVSSCLTSEVYFDDYRARVGWGKDTFLHDELVMRTVIEDYPDMFVPVNPLENNIMYSQPTHCVRNIHAIKKFAGAKRGLLPSLISELGEIVGVPIRGSIPVAKMCSRENVEYLCGELGVDFSVVQHHMAENFKLC